LTQLKSFSDHHFFIASAIWFLLIVLWGFAPSFYLTGFFDDPEPLPFHIVIHGIIFTIWVLLYCIQVYLVKFKNYKLHMTFGLFGIFIMVLMIPTGIFPSIYKYYIGNTSIDGAGHNVFRLFSAYGLFAFAYFYRNHSFYHKRLMLGSMVMLMSAAVFRVSFDLNLEYSQVFNKGAQVFPALVLFIYDYINLRKAVWIDLISVGFVFAIYFFADYFWLSSVGDWFMNLLIFIFVLPFV
jgi:hypothetical protein